MTLAVRPVVPADGPALVPLLHQLGYAWEGPAVTANLARLLASGDDPVLVAERDGSPVGLVALHMMHTLHWSYRIGLPELACGDGEHVGVEISGGERGGGEMVAERARHDAGARGRLQHARGSERRNAFGHDPRAVSEHDRAEAAVVVLWDRPGEGEALVRPRGGGLLCHAVSSFMAVSLIDRPVAAAGDQARNMLNQALPAASKPSRARAE